MKRNNFAARLAASVAALAASAALAQDSQPTAAQRAAEIVTLSPFEVSTQGDDGYIARNTLSASGMNVAVKDLPQSIEIVTSEMIADLGAVRLDEVLRTSAAYTPFQHDINGIAEPVIRGFANDFTLRDGFRVRSGNSDTFNMDRVEIVKGAAAVLYGVSLPGGMVNYVSKAPQWKDSTAVALTAGTFAMRRGSLDFNRHWGNTQRGLAVRLLAMRQDAEDASPWGRDDADFLAPKVQWRPLPGVRLDASYEYSARYTRFAGRMTQITRTVTLPDGRTAPREFLLPPESFDFAWDSAGPSVFNHFTTRTLVLGGEVRVHSSTLLRANLQRNLLDRDQFTRGGVRGDFSSGNFARYPGRVDPAPGQPRAVEGNYDRIKTSNRFLDFRIEGLTQLATRWTKHDIFYGWEQNEQSETARAIVDPPSARVPNSIRPVFVDWLRHVSLDELRRVLAFDAPTPATPVRPRGLVARTGGAYVMTRHSLWQERLLVSLGARFDEDNNGSLLLGLPNLSYVGQYGVLYRISPQISAFGLYNESFIPQVPTSQAGILIPLANGSYEIPPATGLTKEAGVKADFGRLTFSAAAFVVSTTGKALKLWKDPVLTGPGNPEDFITGLGGLERSSGFETSVAASLFKGYQASASYVQAHSRIVNDIAFPVNDGKPLRSAPKHSFAAQNRFSFSKGMLRGAHVGFGVRYSSEAQVELPDSSGNQDTKIRPAYSVWNAFAGYRRKVLERDIALALTVNNVLNDKFWLERNRLGDQRVWRFTLTTMF
jgi:outer membrane receptor protein involved in Fe transport